MHTYVYTKIYDPYRILFPAETLGSYFSQTANFQINADQHARQIPEHTTFLYRWSDGDGPRWSGDVMIMMILMAVVKGW